MEEYVVVSATVDDDHAIKLVRQNSREWDDGTEEPLASFFKEGAKDVREEGRVWIEADNPMLLADVLAWEV